MRIVVVPDSFKSTMTSVEVGTIMADALAARLPDAEIVAWPVADGGEGTVDALVAAVGGRRLTRRVQGPLGQPVEAGFARLADGTAVVEMAAAAGLPLVGDARHPELTTTFGVGGLMVAAARDGAERLIVGLGGSATTDLGVGAAAAAGVRFFDSAGHDFVPLSGDLDRIAAVDASGLDPAVLACAITVMCDIDNPLYGPRGAAHVFGPQKGADPAMVERLDQGLRSACAVIERDLGVALDFPGAGAAGGLGAGMVGFFGATVRPGIEVVLDLIDFDAQLDRADLVLTGEGRIDAQTLSGKVVVGVARRARRHGVPVIAVVGDMADDFAPVYDQGVTAVFSINSQAVPFSQARLRAKADLAATVDNIARLLGVCGPAALSLYRRSA